MLKNVTRVLGLFVVAFTLFTSTGCNTMEGAGQDTQNAGESLERAADRNK